MHRDPPSKNFLNRRRWAVDQRNRVLTQTPAADFDAECAMKLRQLCELAASLELLPHMATTLAVVRAEIARLNSSTRRPAGSLRPMH